jgi:hypothetical protein
LRNHGPREAISQGGVLLRSAGQVAQRALAWERRTGAQSRHLSGSPDTANARHRLHLQIARDQQQRVAMLCCAQKSGIIAEVARKLKCMVQEARHGSGAYSLWAGPDFGSQSELAKLVETIRKLKPRGGVS